MGANEKYEAAMHGFIPATDEVRALYVAGTPAHRVSVHSGYAEFDRWLEAVRAEAKAEAWDEGYGDCWDYHTSQGMIGRQHNPYKEAPNA